MEILLNTKSNNSVDQVEHVVHAETQSTASRFVCQLEMSTLEKEAVNGAG